MPSPTGSECSVSRITTVRGAWASRAPAAGVVPASRGWAAAASGEHARQRDDDEDGGEPSLHAGASAGLGPVGAASARRWVMRITRPAASSEISPAVMKADW